MELNEKCIGCGTAAEVKTFPGTPYCKACLDKTYLELSVIESVRYVIDDRCVMISTRDTSFVKCYPYNPYTQKDLLELYANIIKLCKAHGIKIKYKNHYKRYIRAIWGDYEIQVQEVKDQYIKIVKQAVKVKNRGIHKCYEYDAELQELQHMRDEYHAFFDKDTAIAKVDKLRHKLLTLKGRLENYYYCTPIMYVTL